MSSLSFQSVYLIGVSLILLPTAGSQALYNEYVTPTPDYDFDYNSTFDYSFYSNTSSDDLEKFLKVGNGPEEEEEEEEEVTATMATIQENTERDVVFDTASPPVFLDVGRLVWTLLISLNVLQLQQTL